MRGLTAAGITLFLVGSCTPPPAGGGGGPNGPSVAPATVPSPALPAQVTGLWTMVVTFESVPRLGPADLQASGSLTLLQTGRAVTGTYAEPGLAAPVAGTVEGPILGLSIGPVVQRGATVSLTVQATVTPDARRASGPGAIDVRTRSRWVRVTGRAELVRQAADERRIQPRPTPQPAASTSLMR